MYVIYHIQILWVIKCHSLKLNLTVYAPSVLKQDQFEIYLFCVYMPWDCNEINNLNEFESILNEISALCITNNVEHLCL